MADLLAWLWHWSFWSVSGIAAGALAGAGKMNLALAILLGGYRLPAGRFYLVLRGSALVSRDRG